MAGIRAVVAGARRANRGGRPAGRTERGAVRAAGGALPWGSSGSSVICRDWGMELAVCLSTPPARRIGANPSRGGRTSGPSWLTVPGPFRCRTAFIEGGPRSTQWRRVVGPQVAFRRIAAPEGIGLSAGTRPRSRDARSRREAGDRFGGPGQCRSRRPAASCRYQITEPSDGPSLVLSSGERRKYEANIPPRLPRTRSLSSHLKSAVEFPLRLLAPRARPHRIAGPGPRDGGRHAEPRPDRDVHRHQGLHRADEQLLAH
jgi:hypothetical protein